VWMNHLHVTEQQTWKNSIHYWISHSIFTYI
jgi:hypothetical protein